MKKSDAHLCQRAFLLMFVLREDGWCVVIKCLPRQLGWIIEGSRSEYDAPSEDTTIGRGKWCCEAQWMGQEGYRPSAFAIGEEPWDAVQAVWDRIQQDAKRFTPPALPGSSPADALGLIAVDDRTLPDAAAKALAQALRDEYPHVADHAPNAGTQATAPPAQS